VFGLGLLATVGLACVLPVQGSAAGVLGWVTQFAIGTMFFLYGVRLPREAVVGGLAHWRLHLLVLVTTFAFFPLLGIAASVLVPRFLTKDLYDGILFLCLLPSTVQSSIAFTSIARGNVPAAICSASASNLLGVFLTPLLVATLMSARGGGLALSAITAIAAQLLMPFAVGQFLRPLLGAWAARHRSLLTVTDRGSILLVVYGAFSEAVVMGIWHRLPLGALGSMLLVDAVLLAIVLGATTIVSRRLGFSREDEIAIVFCGSKKSLASGVPMANVLFASRSVGLIVLPLMLFHQVQLMSCAVLARRYGRRNED
jgi:sodium/bile acid cotransporter 7